MVVKAAAAGDRVPQWQVSGVARFLQSGHQVRAMICKVSGDAADGVVDRREFGEVWEAFAIFCSAVCGVREVWERFARAEIVSYRDLEVCEC